MTLCFLDKVSTRTRARGFGLVRRLIRESASYCSYIYIRIYMYEQDGVGWAEIREVL
jgi:hypothetical protein